MSTINTKFVRLSLLALLITLIPAQQAFAEAGAKSSRDAMAIAATRGTYAFSSGNEDDVSMIFTPDFVRHEQQFITPEAKLENISKLIEHQREFYNVEDIQTEPVSVIVDGDKVALHWSAVVTRLPTADADETLPANMKFEGVTISRFENDKIAEQWVFYDSKLVITLMRLRYKSFFNTAP
ncbi:MAG: hypothetical protein ACI9SC_001283 [Gammaproteobacteria bacterium]|jgi:hypothetical protein